MSRIANNPVVVPESVDVKLDGQSLRVKGGKGEMVFDIHENVDLEVQESLIKFRAKDESRNSKALAGTMRSVVSNMVTGVSNGFEKKLTLVGVGYRAQSKGSTLDLSLGFSHPVICAIPEGVSVETPSPTEIIVKGIDKQKVGQMAANIRAYRPPEPYKGKGVRYSDERVVRKEAKKK